MKLEIHYADDWAALYVDGKLTVVGDTYQAEEKAFELLGVQTMVDDSFMRGQTSRDGVAQTLEEVDAYRTERAQRGERARALRAEAKRLLDAADELDD